MHSLAVLEQRKRQGTITTIITITTITILTSQGASPENSLKISLKSSRETSLKTSPGTQIQPRPQYTHECLPHMI